MMIRERPPGGDDGTPSLFVRWGNPHSYGKIRSRRPISFTSMNMLPLPHRLMSRSISSSSGAVPVLRVCPPTG
jgi:hypothetical protein